MKKFPEKSSEVIWGHYSVAEWQDAINRCKYYAKNKGFKDSVVDDLIQEAASRLISGQRKWPPDESWPPNSDKLASVLIMTMRSIAYKERARERKFFYIDDLNKFDSIFDGFSSKIENHDDPEFLYYQEQKEKKYKDIIGRLIFYAKRNKDYIVVKIIKAQIEYGFMTNSELAHHININIAEVQNAKRRLIRMSKRISEPEMTKK